MITPQIEVSEIAQVLGFNITGNDSSDSNFGLYAKREDLHPYGSHKGRSISEMIDLAVAKGSRNFVISSSGNAALAVLRHIQKLNKESLTAGKMKGEKVLSLIILVGKNIDKDKLTSLSDEIKDSHIEIKQVKRPLQNLLELVKNGKTSLRQSTNDDALIGYKSLAREISTIPNVSDVFIGTSSGTTAEALAKYFLENNLPISVNVVQTVSVNPIAVALGANIEETKEAPAAVAAGAQGAKSTATAIIDLVAHRRESVVELVKKTKGSGYIATNTEISKAQNLLKEKTQIETTANGALGLAGLIQAIESGKKFSGSVVFIITGK